MRFSIISQFPEERVIIVLLALSIDFTGTYSFSMYTVQAKAKQTQIGNG